MATNDFVVKNGLDVTENAIIRETTDSSDKDTGALVVEGGVGIEKKLYVGTDLAVGGTAAITGNTTITGDLAVNGADITTTSTGTATVFNANATTLNVGQAATTVSLGATSGTTTVRNALTVGGAFTANSGAAAISPANANVVLSPTGTGVVTINPATLGTINNMSVGASTRSTGAFTTLTANGITTVTSTQASSSVDTGALQVDGGVGINGAIFAGSIQNTPIGSSTRNTGAFTTLTSNAATTFTQNTGSTSTTTGTLVVTGGVGISERLYAGSLQNTPIGSSVASTAAFTSLTANGAVTFTQNTASTTTTSGTLVVSGGIGVTGAINTGLSSSFNGLTSTNTTILSPANATVTISPTGTGTVTIAPATVGSIDNVNVGATTAATGRFTTLTTTSTATLSPANASVLLQPTGTGTVSITPATAGTINNMSIGATTATTGRFTTVQSTVATGTAPFIVASTTAVTNLNADLLDGFNSAQASTVSTVAVRDASGDIVVRLVRSEFANEATISGAMAFRVNNSTDNYIRFCSDTPAIRTFLNVPTRTGGDATGTWAISITGNANTATTATNQSGGTVAATTGSFSSNITVGAAVAVDPSTVTAFAAGTITEGSTGFSAQGIAFGGSTGQHGAIVYGSNLMYFGTENGTDNTMNTRATLSNTGVFSTTSFAGAGTGLTGTAASLSIGGNAATVTNGVYTTGDQTIGGNKTFSGATTLSSTLSMSNTYTNSGSSAAIAVARGATNDPYGTISVSRDQTSSYSYYGLTRVGAMGAGMGLTTGSEFWVGSSTAGHDGVLSGTAWMRVGGSAMTIAGTFTELSSIRYKENIRPIDNSLNKILQLKAVIYDKKDKSSMNEPGLIAEDVLNVIPELVQLDEEGNADGIHYTKITAYLIECIKELNAKIERLEGKQ